MSNDIVLFEAKDGSLAMPVQVKAETVWLSLLQMAQLFGKDKTVIFRHVKNAIADGEIDPKVSIANFAMSLPMVQSLARRAFRMLTAIISTSSSPSGIA